MKHLAILTFLFFFATIASARQENSSFTDCLVLKDQLEKQLSHAWNEAYQPLLCSDNIYQLSKKILPSLNVKTPVYAVYLRMLHPILQAISPALARDQSENWTFHMILVVDGWVLDLDYTSRPKVVGWGEYVESMWPSSKGMRLQFKDAHEFLISRERNGQFNSLEYPYEWLESFSMTPPFLSQCHEY